jgi:hypothetical protein
MTLAECRYFIKEKAALSSPLGVQWVVAEEISLTSLMMRVASVINRKNRLACSAIAVYRPNVAFNPDAFNTYGLELGVSEAMPNLHELLV